MRTKHFESVEVTTYQTPTSVIVDLLVEQPLLAASNIVNGNSPESYSIDEEEFNW